MPHISIKMLAGRSDAQKARISADVTAALMAAAECEAASVSVSIEDVAADRWTEDVYDKEIVSRWDKLHKKPGYGSKAGT